MCIYGNLFNLFCIAEYFEEVVRSADPKMSANRIVAELFGKLNKADLDTYIH
jgi:Asp-tRNA(Asn)/Glu-tRNA(Gln) amidotransferase B subunit